ncbi:hypothetical protein GCM10027435_02250 [Haloparvum alkalitolerans]|uniref:winged helix-turn-helix domain-containing protein n=1 Tax=Haloparvum alkalitolerans TaxID=1042953 RepID=UPI003CF38554
MGQESDTAAYVLNSKYRRGVLRELGDTDRATPTQLAEAVDEPRPHISRALSELREEDVVELRVSEGRSVGRYYGLTDDGEGVWTEIRDRLRKVEWSVSEPSTDRQRRLVDRARDAFGDELRSVGCCEGDSVRFLFADEAVLSDYSTEAFEEMLRTFLFDHSLSEVTIPTDSCQSEVTHFEEFSVLRVPTGEAAGVFVSVAGDGGLDTPDFAETVASMFDDRPP